MISVYIHIPFCVSKCHYCDFNSFGIGRAQAPEESYVQELKHELNRWSWALSSEGKESAQTIFFGGGTPSLFSPQAIESILKELGQVLPKKDFTETTLELNPKTAQIEKMRGFHQVGINRLSIGVQTLDDSALQELARAHDPQDALNALDWAYGAGFEKVSVDLMYGLPEQTMKQLQHTLKILSAYPLKHLSAYELIVEEGTPFYDRSLKGALPLPETEEVLEMHQALEEFTKNKKMLPYEISNYACAGHESEHNCHYWNYDSFIGLGAGAVSFLRREEISDEAWKKIGIEPKEDLYGLRFTNPYSLNDYGECSSSFEKCIIEPISLSTAMGEFMMMGLRKRSGIRYSDFENKFGVIFPKRFMGLVQRAFENGLAIVNEEGCWLSKRGVMLSNEVMQEFIGDGVGDMILAS